MPRSLLFLVLFLFCLAPLAGLAWLTHHPENEVLAAAREWPVLGPAARWFRAQYLPPERPLDDQIGRVPSISEGVLAGAGEEAMAEAAETPSLSLGRRIWLLPQTSLHRAPRASAPVLVRLQATTAAVELERRGKWYRVRYSGFEGWAYLENYDPNRDPPYGEAPEPPRPVRSQAPDPEQLAEARRLLGDEQHEAQLGPYRLYTNLEDGSLLDHLHAIALHVESAYSMRYGRQPLGSPREVVVLYASEIPYRLLVARSPRLHGLHSSGFNAAGLVVLYVGDRRRDEVSATFIHELVHLLNRRSLGPALPPWLDEGLADDLGHLRVAADGSLVVDSLSGARFESAGRTEIFGAFAALTLLEAADREGRLVALHELTTLDWDAFVRSDRINLHYAASSFFIRYVLQADGGRFAEFFRAFLDDVAAGHPAEGEALRSRLGVEWRDLDVGWESWLHDLSQELGI